MDWANAQGYGQVILQGGPGGDPWDANPNRHDTFGLFDVNRDGSVSTDEYYYNDLDGNGVLSDDERDEDGDGLSNYDETHGRMFEGYWSGCYSTEKVFHVGYTGTAVTNPDTDGDGVLDGADDTDHDDIPNMDELSRIDASSGLDDGEAACKARTTGLPALDPKNNHPNAYGRVNPFNPCLPFRGSRTCPHIVNGATGAPFDGSPNWYSLQ